MDDRLDAVKERMANASCPAGNIQGRANNIIARIRQLQRDGKGCDLETYERLTSTIESGLSVTEEALGAFERVLETDDM